MLCKHDATFLISLNGVLHVLAQTSGLYILHIIGSCWSLLLSNYISRGMFRFTFLILLGSIVPCHQIYLWAYYGFESIHGLYCINIFLVESCHDNIPHADPLVLHYNVFLELELVKFMWVLSASYWMQSLVSYGQKWQLVWSLQCLKCLWSACYSQLCPT